jgi:N-acetylglucosaminyldiphosphoundecaprenol N-acetyl-beta-D-mannosaminyltransferase
MSAPPTIHLFGIHIHRVTMEDTVEVLADWMLAGRGAGPCRYVVTPNVDHLVKLRSNAALAAAYRDAALVVPDGWPIVTASRWLGQPLPERVAGSDLVPRLLEHFSNARGWGGWGEAKRPLRELAARSRRQLRFQSTDGVALGARCARPQPPTSVQPPDAHPLGLRVYLLGAAPGVGALAAENVERRWPGVKVCGLASPSPGFETDRELCRRIVEEINSKSPDLLVVGLGAPKQEVWLQQYAPQLQVPVAIAAGATIDFLAGRQRRAPVWSQRLRLEWLFRLATNPRRLAPRYALDAVVFPRMLAMEWWRTWRPKSAIR